MTWMPRAVCSCSWRPRPLTSQWLAARLWSKAAWAAWGKPCLFCCIHRFKKRADAPVYDGMLLLLLLCSNNNGESTVHVKFVRGAANVDLRDASRLFANQNRVCMVFFDVRQGDVWVCGALIASSHPLVSGVIQWSSLPISFPAGRQQPGSTQHLHERCSKSRRLNRLSLLRVRGGLVRPQHVR